MKLKKPKKDSLGESFGPLEIEQIERLLRFMNENNLEEFEYCRGDLRVRMRKPSAGMVSAEPHGAAMIIAREEAAARGAGVRAEAPGVEDLHQVKSPIVGTFYAAPTPGAEAFVKVGAHVEAGQTLCIVEAMKLMNESESDVSGEVVRVFVENGQPVEYGQALFGIRASRKK
jgi:acetyl-CoA carboxylase biotin carboxyl carrier protein